MKGVLNGYSNHVHWNVMLTNWEYSTYNRTKHTTSKQHTFVVEKIIFLLPWQWHPFKKSETYMHI
jgi:hypothetical protein